MPPPPPPAPSSGPAPESSRPRLASPTASAPACASPTASRPPTSWRAPSPPTAARIFTVNVDTIGGSGTLASWTINLAGLVGSTGPQGTTGLTGATEAQGAHRHPGPCGQRHVHLDRRRHQRLDPDRGYRQLRQASTASVWIQSLVAPPVQVDVALPAGPWMPVGTLGSGGTGEAGGALRSGRSDQAREVDGPGRERPEPPMVSTFTVKIRAAVGGDGALHEVGGRDAVGDAHAGADAVGEAGLGREPWSRSR